MYSVYVENIKSGRAISSPRQSHSSEQQLQTFWREGSVCFRAQRSLWFFNHKACFSSACFTSSRSVFSSERSFKREKLALHFSFLSTRGRELYIWQCCLICPDDLIKYRTRSTAFKLATKERLIKKKTKTFQGATRSSISKVALWA